MNKLWAAVIIIILVTALCITETMYTLNTSAMVEEKIENAVSFYEKGDDKKAKEEIKSANETWHSKRQLMDIFLYHDTVDQIGTTLTAAEKYLGSSKDDFPVECAKAKEQLNSLKEAQLPNFENIL